MLEKIRRLSTTKIPDTVGGRVTGVLVETLAALVLYPVVKKLEDRMDEELEKKNGKQKRV